MLLNEIGDPNRKAQLDAVLASMKKQYAPRPKRSPEEVADRQRQQTDRDVRRKRVEQALEPLAQKFSRDQFEQFKQEAEAMISPEELKSVDLNYVFRRYNPELWAEFQKSWDDYGKARDASADAGGTNPMIHSLSRTGSNNWTGD